MLTDFALRNLKPHEILYKVADRNGMYVIVSPKGTITFRYDYRINGRRETLTIGRYGFEGISLAEAREKLRRARWLLGEGTSPALQKQREKGTGSEAFTFSDHASRWLYGATMAESIRSMRKSVLDRDIMPAFNKRLLCEIYGEDLRALCLRVRARGAPAATVQIRDLVKQIYDYAKSRSLWSRGPKSRAYHWNRLPFTICAVRDRRCCTNWVSTGIGSRSSLRMKMDGPRARSTKRRSTLSNGDTCCNIGRT